MQRNLALAKTSVKRRSERWQNKFIAALSRLPSVKHAAKAAGVSRWKVYHHHKSDPEFAERWKEALDHSLDDLEAKVFQIALNGEECNAAAVGLAQWLLRCHRPRPYDPVNRSEVAVAAGVIILPGKKQGAE